MIGLCQEGKSSPDALRSSAGLDSSPRLLTSAYWQDRFQSKNDRDRFIACPEIDSFVTTAALLYPASRSLHLEAPLTQSLTPFESLLFNIVLATLAIGLPVLVVLSIRFLWDRNLNLGRSKELEKLIWQLHRIAKRNGASNEFVISRRSAGHGRASRSRLSPAACCPTSRRYLERCTPSAAAAAPTPATDQPTVQQPVTPPPTAQQASLPALERRAPSAEAPRGGVNSMFGL